MENCIFCTIATSDPHNQIIWQNDDAVAFHNIDPKAPKHLLVIPRKHIAMFDELDDPELAGRLVMAVREVAHANGLKGAYRVGVNNGKSVGMTIEHLHFHILGGKEMAE